MTASALNPRNVLGIGIDITYQSISLILKRLQDRYPDDWPQIEAHIKPDGKKTEKAIVEVKGGGTGVNDVGRLAQVMEREGAKIGVLITAQLPTRAMEADAAAVGIWENEYTGRKHARLQIITLAELFQNKRPDIPWVDTTVGKKAKREETGKQGTLL